jgi:DNA-directed RNA polymerase specialized sigma24 family protein
MQRSDPSPEWVIAGPDGKSRSYSKSHERLLDAARNAWPSALSYAFTEDVPDCACLATEVWEELLRSVLRTMQRLGDLHHITNLESYLIGGFRHRFQRAVLKERRHRQKLLSAESVEQLETIGRIQDWVPVERMERGLLVKQTVSLMDPWTRRVWTYIKYGYSIKEIARHLGLTEYQVEFRYRRRLARLRAYICRHGRNAA